MKKEKLKTLKDMNSKLYITKEDEDNDVRWIKRDELKAEAVKWVKFYRKRDGLDDWERAEGLMEFNNITEEDLK